MTYDVLIIGAGPAGCSAALTLRNRNKTVLMAYTGDGALGLAEKINNCPGVRGKSGQEIAELYRAEALDAGAEIRKEKVSQLLPMGDTFSAIVGADIISARSVLLTIGASRGREIPGEKELVGRGVSYCATCDAMLYRGRPVLVVGTDQESVESFESDIYSAVIRAVGGAGTPFESGSILNPQNPNIDAGTRARENASAAAKEFRGSEAESVSSGTVEV